MNGIIIGAIAAVIIGAVATGVYVGYTPQEDSKITSPTTTDVTKEIIQPFTEANTERILSSPVVSEPTSPYSPPLSPDYEPCSGNARCISGTVTQVIDGDTIRVDGQSIRFALASTPELGEYGGYDAKDFVESICPAGSSALVDEDDLQTEGSYGRIVGVIYCNGYNLNQAVLDSGYATLSTYFCDSSEFADEAWSVNHGCGTVEPVQAVEEPVISEPVVEPAAPSCDPSYPTVCIAPYPPDLDCGEISHRNFTVLQPDPHRFDGDKDGIGCES